MEEIKYFRLEYLRKKFIRKKNLKKYISVSSIERKQCVKIGTLVGPEVETRRRSIKKDVFKNFVKFTGKHLSWSNFFNKVARCRCP